MTQAFPFFRDPDRGRNGKWKVTDHGKQRIGSNLPELTASGRKCGRRYRREPGEDRPLKGDDRDILWHADIHATQCLDRKAGQFIVLTDQSGTLGGLHGEERFEQLRVKM